MASVGFVGAPPRGARGGVGPFPKQEHRKRFDPSQPPLLRFALIRLTDRHHRLAFTHHHILLDGWSVPIFWQELLETYRAGGDTSRLPRVAAYQDYLYWLKRQDVAAAQRKWQESLAGLAESTLLTRRLQNHGPAKTVSLRLSAPLTAKLTHLCRSHNLTLNTLVQGAWGLLLCRLTGRADVVFGTTVAERPPELPGVERLIGALINTLPVACAWSLPIRSSTC